MATYKTSLGRVAFGNLVEARTSEFGKTEWTLGLVIDEPSANEMLLRMDEDLDGYRKGGPQRANFPALSSIRTGIKPSETKQEDGTKVPDPGNFLCVFKRQTTWKSKLGDVNKNTPPRMYDSLGRIIDPIEVPRGSKGVVVYEHSIYNNPGNKGISLRLVGFQIAELADSDSVLMEPIEGGTFVSEPEEPARNDA